MLRHKSTASDAPRSHTRKVSVMPRIARPARLAMATAAVAALLALAGCSGSADPAASSADPAADFVTPGKLTIATGQSAYEPSVYDDDLLESVKAQAERGWLSALASGEERADLISQYALLHDDPGYINTGLDRVLAATVDEVHAAAREWLAPEHVVCVAYLATGEQEEEEAA